MLCKIGCYVLGVVAVLGIMATGVAIGIWLDWLADHHPVIGWMMVGTFVIAIVAGWARSIGKSLMSPLCDRAEASRSTVDPADAERARIWNKGYRAGYRVGVTKRRDVDCRVITEVPAGY